MSRKINKAVYLLIEKYHRLYGLEVYGFNSGHGPGYAGFQLAAERCWDRRNGTANYDNMPGSGQQVLVCYFTHVGIPAWCAGEQLELQGWQAQRTSNIIQWLEKHLTFHELFERYEPQISRWRTAYSVECSEQYLLMVNLAGLLASRQSNFPSAPGQLFSDMDYEAHNKVNHIASRLGGLDPRTDILGVSGCLIGRNGKALVGEQLIDVWRMRVQGQPCESIVNFLLDARESAEGELVKQCDSSKAN